VVAGGVGGVSGFASVGVAGSDEVSLGLAFFFTFSWLSSSPSSARFHLAYTLFSGSKIKF
jgi:hypothetical protein